MLRKLAGGVPIEWLYACSPHSSHSRSYSLAGMGVVASEIIHARPGSRGFGHFSRHAAHRDPSLQP